MARSNGYRPRAAVRTEVLALRAQLAELTDDQWMKASCIMQNITSLLGHTGGPMNGKIEPRACRYCRHYGHTRQWCKKRLAVLKAREERELDAIAAEDRARGIGTEREDSNWATYCKRADKAYRDLCVIKDNWTDKEWATEFRKRAGDYDHITDQLTW